jgi:citronellol/citronellal dehydrogenase
MTQPEPQFGRSDDELAAMPLTFRDGLFDGQIALVSGSGRGIGKAIAYQLARLGAKVALCGRDEARLNTTAEKLRALGADVMAHPMSIRDPDAVSRLYDAVWQKFGTLDLVVNNAGGQFPQAAIDFSPKGWNAVIDTNLNGTWYMMQAAARHWRDAGHPGSIVNIVVVTTHGLYGIAHSVAARSGVVGLSRSVAVEWAPLNIRVNCVAPGLIETEGWKVYSPEARAAYPRSNPMMRAGSAWDIAEACGYLAGPSGGFVTGETLTVDGGGQLWGETWTTGKPPYFVGG